MILIVGAGAIGQWLAALLRLRAAESVTVLCRPRQLETLRGGILLGSERAQVEPVVELQDGTAFSDVLFCVKAYQLPEAVAQVQAAGLQAERYWGFQNGVGTDPSIAAAFPAAWCGAMTTTVPVYVEENRVLPGPKGGLAWGSLNDPAGAPSWLSRMGLACFAATRVDSMKFSKLLLNLTCNASCALLDVLPGAVVNHRRMFDIELTCLRETLSVLKASKIPVMDLPGYAVTQMAALAPLPGFILRGILGGKIRKARGDKPPSLLLDLRGGRRQSEVEVLNGAVVRLGAQCGVPTPANRWLYESLSAVVREPELWDNYRGKIDQVSRQALAALVGNSGG